MISSETQQRSHVPKFGDWEDDNIPYTAFFDTARKENGGVHVMRNPNDPEDNPEAFAHGPGLGLNSRQNPMLHKPVSSEEKPETVTRQPSRQYSRKSSEQQQKPASVASGSGSDKSSSDHWLMQAAFRRQKSEGNKSLAAEESHMRSNSAAGESQGQRRPTHASDARHQRTASVPKFGEWDEADPTSGEGFTVIFDRVKREKQVAAAAFPSQPAFYFDANQQKQPTPKSCPSKFCCCLFSRGGK